MKKNLEDQKLKFDGQWAAKLKKRWQYLYNYEFCGLALSFISIYEINYYFLETLLTKKKHP